MRTRSLAALLLLLQAGAATGQNLGTDTALTRAMRYAEDYQRELSAIVGEERQTQREIRADGSIKQQRDLVADILLVKSAQRLVIFRDVSHADGKPVRNREERLRNLFLNPQPNAFAQGDAIARESTRYNLGMTRILDSLMLPIWILHPKVRPRFRFALENGVLRFDETQSPSMMRSGRRGGLADMPLRGWLTTDPETGGLRAATMAAANGTSEVSAEIRYEEHPMVKLLVPLMMQQRYRRSSDPRADVLEVSSTYSNWRRFEVKTDERIEGPK